MLTPPRDRLPRSTIPRHYNLAIRTDLVEGTWSGIVEISLEIVSLVDSITLHVHEPLVLRDAVLVPFDPTTGSLGQRRRNAGWTIDTKLQRVAISFEGGTIDEGWYKLGMRWDGRMEPSMIGYSSATYVPPGSNDADEVRYAFTQFQPCDARRAFPCFDEPDLKATFAITMISRVGTTSIANMPVESTTRLDGDGEFPRTELLDEGFLPSSTGRSDQGAGWELVKFLPTPRMSTYIVAFANGPFSSLSLVYKPPSRPDRPVSLGIYTLAHEIEQARFVLDLGPTLLALYEREFDLAYPLPKLDVLAVPAFGNGAMENFGLCIGGSSVYLLDDDSTGIAQKKSTFSTQSHEIAHQWFGNLVTMEWWDDLWLNEAFATIVGEVIVTDKVHPEWKAHASFIAEHLGRALRLDSVRSSHPILMPCPDENTINQIFDAVSYSKGASVLKMLSNFVGERVFVRGVSTYLKRHLWGNARTADLFKGISDEYGQDISEMMKNWTTKIGFPLITVDETDTGIKLRQNRFLSTADATPEEDETIWHVPIEPLVVSNGKKEIKRGVVLTERESTFDIDDVKNATYKINAETCGVYRVLYPADRLVKIGEEAGKPDSAFSLNDRMGLVQDASVLASSGYAKTSSALSLLAKMGNEKENLVWQEIASALDALATTWWEQPAPIRGAIDAFRRDLFRPIVDRVGREYLASDDSDVVELRTLALTTLAEAGDEATIADFKRRFTRFLEHDDESLISADLRRPIYVTAVLHGSGREYRKVLEVYRNPLSPDHKKSARGGLTATSDPSLVAETLELMRSGQVPIHEVPAFGRSLASRPAAIRPYWAWFVELGHGIIDRFKGPFYVSAFVATTFDAFSSFADVRIVEETFEHKDRSAYEQAYEQGLDKVRSKAMWLTRDSQDVEAWLRENGYLS
ncbi:hypothetical protein JCM10212_004038 [Sporobolomyces blumeae]